MDLVYVFIRENKLWFQYNRHNEPGAHELPKHAECAGMLALLLNGSLQKPDIVQWNKAHLAHKYNFVCRQN